MPGTDVFVDSNVVIYLLSEDAEKAGRAETLLAAGPALSAQVLNEVANVMRRKLRMSWQDAREFLVHVRALCHCEPITEHTHVEGLRLAERYNLSVYDGLIAASALLAGCGTLYSEDLQDGLLLDKRVRVNNPFSHWR